MEKLKGCTYKITHMSVASYPILKLKPRTKFYHSVFFFLFNVFLYETFMRQANEIICIFIKGLNFYLVPWLVVQDIWQLKYRLFCRSNHFSFLLFFLILFMCSLIFVNIKLNISNTYSHRVTNLYLNYYLVPSFVV